MKAIVCTKYGPPEVLVQKEMLKPVPKDNEVLVKIHATAVTASDIFIRSSDVPLIMRIPMRLMIGISKPRNPIIGFVFAGEVESVGKEMTRFKAGDQVYGTTGWTLGAYAEYICMTETDSPKRGCIALKPKNNSYEESTATIYGGLLALQQLEKGDINPGSKVLIYGASGTTGTIAVQIAKSFGAEVTGVCSTKNLELVKSLGADQTLDYTKQDSLKPDEQYDFILDAVGKMKTSKLKEACKKALTPNGIYTSIDDENMLLDSERVRRVTEMAEAGKIKPVIDKVYPLDEMVEAHRYVGKKHKVGGVAITVQHND